METEVHLRMRCFGCRERIRPDGDHYVHDTPGKSEDGKEYSARDKWGHYLLHRATPSPPRRRPKR